MRVIHAAILPKIRDAIREADGEGLLIEYIELSTKEFDRLVQELHPHIDFKGGVTRVLYKVGTPTREANIEGVRVVEVK